MLERGHSLRTRPGVCRIVGEIKSQDIVIHEPNYDPEEIARLMDSMNAWGPLGPALEKAMRKEMGDAACEALGYHGWAGIGGG